MAPTGNRRHLDTSPCTSKHPVECRGFTPRSISEALLRSKHEDRSIQGLNRPSAILRDSDSRMAHLRWQHTPRDAPSTVDHDARQSFARNTALRFCHLHHFPIVLSTPDDYTASACPEFRGLPPLESKPQPPASLLMRHGHHHARCYSWHACMHQTSAACAMPRCPSLDLHVLALAPALALTLVLVRALLPASLSASVSALTRLVAWMGDG